MPRTRRERYESWKPPTTLRSIVPRLGVPRRPDVTSLECDQNCGKPKVMQQYRKQLSGFSRPGGGKLTISQLERPGGAVVVDISDSVASCGACSRHCIQHETQTHTQYNYSPDDAVAKLPSGFSQGISANSGGQNMTGNAAANGNLGGPISSLASWIGSTGSFVVVGGNPTNVGTLNSYAPVITLQDNSTITKYVGPALFNPSTNEWSPMGGGLYCLPASSTGAATGTNDTITGPYPFTVFAMSNYVYCTGLFNRAYNTRDTYETCSGVARFDMVNRVWDNCKSVAFLASTNAQYNVPPPPRATFGNPAAYSGGVGAGDPDALDLSIVDGWNASYVPANAITEMHGKIVFGGNFREVECEPGWGEGPASGIAFYDPSPSAENAWSTTIVSELEAPNPWNGPDLENFTLDSITGWLHGTLSSYPRLHFQGINALYVNGNKLYVGGRFSGVVTRSLGTISDGTVLNTSNVAVYELLPTADTWSGSWSSVGGGLPFHGTGYSTVLTIATSASTLYVGGMFQYDLGSGNTANGLVQLTSGGAAFTSVSPGGVELSYTRASATGSGPAPARLVDPPYVIDLKVYHDMLIVGGWFRVGAGPSISNVVALVPSGTSAGWRQLGSTTGQTHVGLVATNNIGVSVASIVPHGAGQLWMAGQINSANLSTSSPSVLRSGQTANAFYYSFAEEVDVTDCVEWSSGVEELITAIDWPPVKDFKTGTYYTDASANEYGVCISCDPQSKVIRSLVKPRLQFHGSTATYLQSRCMTYDQRLSTQKIPGIVYIDPVTKLPLPPSEYDEGPQSYQATPCVRTCGNGQIIPVVYKPNNTRFARQGAVSNGARMAGLGHNVQTVNGGSYGTAYGLSAANYGDYQGEETGSYYIKTQPQRCMRFDFTGLNRRYSGATPGPPIPPPPPPPPTVGPASHVIPQLPSSWEGIGNVVLSGNAGGYPALDYSTIMNNFWFLRGDEDVWLMEGSGATTAIVLAFGPMVNPYVFPVSPTFLIQQQIGSPFVPAPGIQAFIGVPSGPGTVISGAPNVITGVPAGPPYDIIPRRNPSVLSITTTQYSVILPGFPTGFTAIDFQNYWPAFFAPTLAPISVVGGATALPNPPPAPATLEIQFEITNLVFSANSYCVGGPCASDVAQQATFNIEISSIANGGNDWVLADNPVLSANFPDADTSTPFPPLPAPTWEPNNNMKELFRGMIRVKITEVS